MNHPIRANLEIATAGGTEWIRCSKCQRKHCGAGEDWRQFCKFRLLPPTKAGVLMVDLSGKYLLRQFYCASCAVLLETDFVEESSIDAGRA
jgi:hypothetical protein